MFPKFLFFVEYTYGWGIPLSRCTRGCLLQSSAALQGQATRASVVAGIRPLTPALLPQFPRGLRGGSASCRSPREGEPFESEIHRASNSSPGHCLTLLRVRHLLGKCVAFPSVPLSLASLLLLPHPHPEHSPE